MDAYDVFKKLTKGARFKRPKKQVLDSKPNSLNSNQSTVNIKEEPIDRGGGENDSPEITLLGSITTGDQTKKHKRKATDTLDDRKIKLLRQENINQKRNALNINVVGKHIAEPIDSFDELPIKLVDISSNLKSCGYTEPTPIQKQAIPVMLEGRQVLACAPTGSGKTAAFLVPILHHLEGPQCQGFRAVILCPTRELAKQTQRECIRLSEGRGFRIHVISKIAKALTQFGGKSSKKFDILVTTPNRLCYLLSQDPPGISLAHVEWLIIDEADKLFEEGVNSFRDQLKQILQSCTHKEKKIGMFSATYMPVVAKWCVHNMKGLVRIMVGQRNAATDSVEQELLFVGNESGKLIAFRDIVRKGLTPPVLVFVQSKERAQQLFSELIYDGINVDAIHADRTQLQRDNTVRSFREGKIWVLICTELMARGVDFKGVNLVINYDFPSSAISYVHRIGRAGRAGRKGKAITFFTTEDNVNLRSIAHVIKQSGGDVPDYMLAMKKRSKRDIKKLKSSAPHRDDITTTPIYELKMREKWRRQMGKHEPSKFKQSKNISKNKKNSKEKKKGMNK